ncbi:hypothetical protein EV363DRAFT_1293423 [Boletus edulis]|nr:hypothetical protein EV363DRAFT_1293423 [Boletus edulis]
MHGDYPWHGVQILQVLEITGGNRVKQEKLKIIKGDLGHRNIVKGGKIDGIDPRSDGNECIIKTSVLHQVRGLEDQVEVEEARTNIKCDCKHRINADDIQIDGKGCGTTTATSTAHRNSK